MNACLNFLATALMLPQITGASGFSLSHQTIYCVLSYPKNCLNGDIKSGWFRPVWTSNESEMLLVCEYK